MPIMTRNKASELVVWT